MPANPSQRVLGLLECQVLLTRGSRLVKLAVDEEVINDTAGAPVNVISPSLNAGGMLFVDKNTAAPAELLKLMFIWRAWDMIQTAVKAALKEK